MLRRCLYALLATLLLCTGAGAAAREKMPYGGYVYPAGLKAGTTVRATVGGQNLQGTSAVHFTGGGVRAAILEHVRPLTNKQLGDAGQHLRKLMRERVAQATGRPVPADPAGAKPLDPLPDHPWLRDLDKKSLKELDDLRVRLFDPKRQPNAQLGEWIIMDITADAGAPPGVRELRLETRLGLSNPVRFEVGALPEVLEQEPNALKDVTQAADLPVLFAGQIMPGDVDCFRFRARQGQNLVITTHARSLVPYLADAVPGWFQAVLTLYDAQGKELAYDDDFRFDPDPVLFFRVPSDGEYLLQIHDSIYRGREDFVYRITVGEQPFVTSLFPLGGRVGQPFSATLTGWNLPPGSVQLEPGADGPALREVSWRFGDWTSNTVRYAVDSLPETIENEPNDLATPQKVSLPCNLNGRIAKRGDLDFFRFGGKAGEEIVAEVLARRLGSPLDALVRLMDAGGRVIAWNDDCEDRQSALLTHHADSYLTARLPQTGEYLLQLSDTQQNAGDDHAYRLRLSLRRPDFALRVTPSSLLLGAGRAEAVTVFALRQEGFAGDIEVSLDGAPSGFTLAGGRIPAGRDRVQMTISAPQASLSEPVGLKLHGRAVIGGTTLKRPVLPAEDMMQAFAYRHLVPAQELSVVVSRTQRAMPAFGMPDQPLRIPEGGTVTLEIKSPLKSLPANVKLELSDPPEGLKLKEVKSLPNGLGLVLQAEGPRLKAGYADNLVIAIVAEYESKRPDGKMGRWRGSVSALPAVPFEVVAQ